MCHYSGKTKSVSSDPPKQKNLAIDVLVNDFVELIKVVYPDTTSAPSLLVSQLSLYFDSSFLPCGKLVGHSMGGAITTRAVSLLQSLKYSIAGTVVLDVVEGSALDALPHMNSILNARPMGFDSIQRAVEWQYVFIFLFSRKPPTDRDRTYQCPSVLQQIQFAT
jgi:protein phosphatase methylesterase 1